MRVTSLLLLREHVPSLILDERKEDSLRLSAIVLAVTKSILRIYTAILDLYEGRRSSSPRLPTVLPLSQRLTNTQTS